MLRSRAEIYELLKELGAQEHLLLHLRLVGEAADILIQAYTKMGLSFNAGLVELGVAVHDAGKILHPQELEAPGSLHEAAGEKLLLAQGVPAEIAKCCVSHANWHGAEVTLEERMVALADKLWKGKREEDLELKVIDEVAARLDKGRWEVFESLDTVFEEIAAGGTDRLHRSRAAQPFHPADVPRQDGSNPHENS